MWLRNGGLLAAVLALLSFALVSFGAWFTLTQRSTCDILFAMCSPTGIGMITVAIVIASGWLLAYAFDQAEQAFVLFRERRPRDAGAGD
ncbi:MAG: hypothetical protein ACOX9R_13510 [Armatimonadota bacterium]|jgi:hypothetical protein